MYRDVSNLKVIAAHSDKKALNIAKQKGALILGTVHNRDYPAGMHWVDVFYYQAGLDRQLRYTNFGLNRDVAREKKLKRKLCGDGDDYIFVHDDWKRGYRIDGRYTDNKTVVRARKGLTRNIFDYLSVIEGAKEIHCIDSSFLCLIDILFHNNHVGREFFLHDYARDGWRPNVNEFWNVVHG